MVSTRSLSTIGAGLLLTLSTLAFASADPAPEALPYEDALQQPALFTRTAIADPDALAHLTRRAVARLDRLERRGMCCRTYIESARFAGPPPKCDPADPCKFLGAGSREGAQR